MKTTVWASIENGGDGSAYTRMFLKEEEEAIQAQEADDEGWAEVCIKRIESYIGSNVHKEAMKNSSNI